MLLMSPSLGRLLCLVVIADLLQTEGTSSILNHLDHALSFERSLKNRWYRFSLDSVSIDVLVSILKNGSRFFSPLFCLPIPKESFCIFYSVRIVSLE